VECDGNRPCRSPTIYPESTTRRLKWVHACVSHILSINERSGRRCYSWQYRTISTLALSVRTGIACASVCYLPAAIRAKRTMMSVSWKMAHNVHRRDQEPAGGSLFSSPVYMKDSAIWTAKEVEGGEPAEQCTFTCIFERRDQRRGDGSISRKNSTTTTRLQDHDIGTAVEGHAVDVIATANGRQTLNR